MKFSTIILPAMLLMQLLFCACKHVPDNTHQSSSQTTTSIDSTLYAITDTSKYYFEIMLYKRNDTIVRSTVYCYDKENNYLGYSHVDGFNDWRGMKISDTMKVPCDYIVDEEKDPSVKWYATMAFSKNRSSIYWRFDDKIKLQKDTSTIFYYLPDSCKLVATK